MNSVRLLALVLLGLTGSGTATALDAGDDRPKVGLALSGGGARGVAHVGVLRALEELRIPIDYIAGTSMGSIVGGLYAAGYTPDEIERVVRDTDWNAALTDRPPRREATMRKKELDSSFLIPYRVGLNEGRIQLPLGVIEGQHLDQIFQGALLPAKDVSDFDQLSIPFRAVATDLVTGAEVVLSSGSLADALRASMSVPGAFAPVEIDGRLLVDGGMSNNLPISVVRDMGADIVIAVDISSPLLGREQLDSVLTVTEQLTGFLTRKNVEQQIATLGPSDVLLVPRLDAFSAADFENALSVVPAGYEAVMASRAAFAALESPTLPADRGRPDVRALAEKEYILHFIELNNRSVLSDELLLSRIEGEIGQPVDFDRLNQDMDDIYGLDVFQSVTYDPVRNAQGQTGIRVNAVPRAWGPNYLQIGLEVSDDFAGDSDFTVGAAYTRNALNSLGGELRAQVQIGREDRLEFDFYQPVDAEARWFVQPDAYWAREQLNVFFDDETLAELEIAGPGISLGVGRNVDTTNQFRLDYYLAHRRADVLVGFDQLLVDDDADTGELVLRYLHDSQDNLWFPTQGGLATAAFRLARDELGSDADYEQAFGYLSWAGSFGKNTLVSSLQAGYSLDDATPFERWFELGGFGRLSGTSPDQFSGRHSALAALGFYRRLNEIKLAPVYAGMTLEAGNAWRNESEIGFDNLVYAGSLFLGANTPIGPLYLAWGYADTGDHSWYFYLGNPWRQRRY